MVDDIRKSDIVVPHAGRDKGRLMFVLNVHDDGNLSLADGKLRKCEKPKIKKAKHVTLYQRGDGRISQKIVLGEKLSNSEIRKELAYLASAQTSKGR